MLASWNRRKIIVLYRESNLRFVKLLLSSSLMVPQLNQPWETTRYLQNRINKIHHQHVRKRQTLFEMKLCNNVLTKGKKPHPARSVMDKARQYLLATHHSRRQRERLQFKLNMTRIARVQVTAAAVTSVPATQNKQKTNRNDKQRTNSPYPPLTFAKSVYTTLKIQLLTLSI